MKLKKILAAVAAAAVAVSTMAINAFAADEYQARICFADTAWAVSEMGDGATSVTITGDGQYTLETTAVAGAADFGVFCLDFIGMNAAAPEATATLDKIEIDGAELSFDASKLMFGDLEDNGNYRIDIFNQYTETKENPGVNAATPISSSLKLTFTVSGLGGAAEAPAAETATEATTEAPATGNVAVASIVSVMALAGAAAIVSKKRG